MEENQSTPPPAQASKPPEEATSSLPLDALDNQETTVIESAGVTAGTEPKQKDDSQESVKSHSVGSFVGKLLSRVNIYLLAFILLIVVSFVVVFIVIHSSNKQAAEQRNINSQELTQEAIDSLSGNEAIVGDPKQLLTVESNAVFAGKVLIRDGLDVAGSIKVGGDISLPSITVSGRSTFNEVQANSLSISGDTSLQGVLTVQSSLTVNGQVSFGGSFSASSATLDALHLNGDFHFNGHIDAGGGTPSVSGGGAIGSGGTVTISGTDTAGTITVNMGAGATGGVLASVTFSKAYSSNPHVVFSPVGAPAAYAYVSTRSPSGFSIATSIGLPAGSISFDYIVID